MNINPIQIDTSKIITKPTKLEELIGEVFVYDEMIKGVVDIKNEKLAMGGEFHAHSEKMLINNGSDSDNCWGFSIYFDNREVVYKSQVNIKPQLNNETKEIKDPLIIEQMKKVIHLYLI
jgi:Protein of unknown function (DUF5674)